MRALLNVNVLLALLDSDHVDHRRTSAASMLGSWTAPPARLASGDRRVPARAGNGARRALRHIRPHPVPGFGARRFRGAPDCLVVRIPASRPYRSSRACTPSK